MYKSTNTIIPFEISLANLKFKFQLIVVYKQEYLALPKVVNNYKCNNTGKNYVLIFPPPTRKWKKFFTIFMYKK